MYTQAIVNIMGATLLVALGFVLAMMVIYAGVLTPNYQPQSETWHVQGN